MLLFWTATALGAAEAAPRPPPARELRQNLLLPGDHAGVVAVVLVVVAEQVEDAVEGQLRQALLDVERAGHGARDPALARRPVVALLLLPHPQVLPHDPLHDEGRHDHLPEVHLQLVPGGRQDLRPPRLVEGEAQDVRALVDAPVLPVELPDFFFSCDPHID
eukprot:CAMPEP_0194720548 /NCGR_PEP_ID=MMETSP0296-20130528/11881_1 /TAXON_ID=39354 /ORGANISM="Heterosigma akashiwo, Strain CCMP2393" /LENGTH=161 /DNA_ID=CAMNT_0039622759 /DNA_START=264 /DNA_END=746 /DNA_ORIENTATION=+